MKQWNIGILGAGGIAQKMADTISRMENVNCYAIASRTQSKADAFAVRNNCKPYGSYEALVADPSVDLVYVATPHSAHFENATLCIEYGKPALVEKAFTVNEQQAIKLFRNATEHSVFITEAIWTRYMPFVETIHQMLASGIIGKPSMLTANLGYPISDKPRLIQPDLAGGALLDVGVYALNFAAMFFGSDIQRTVSTCTYTATGVDEQNSITIVYNDGRMAVLNSSMLSQSDRYGYIHGSKGFLQIENINNFQRATAFTNEGSILADYRCPVQITGYEYEVEACIDALASGHLECPHMKHQETLRILHQMDSLRHNWNIKYPCE